LKFNKKKLHGTSYIYLLYIFYVGCFELLYMTYILHSMYDVCMCMYVMYMYVKLHVCMSTGS